MRKQNKIDPRELIPATRPKRSFTQGPIPAAPLVGSTEIIFDMAGVASAGGDLKFVLPTSRVKPRGIVFVFDVSLYHSEAAKTFTFFDLSRQAPEDASPVTIYRRQYLPGLALPTVISFATPLPFPLGGDAIYNYTPFVSLNFGGGVGGVGAIAVLNANWVFYEWDAALGISGAPALGGISAAGGGGSPGLKRFDFSE